MGSYCRMSVPKAVVLFLSCKRRFYHCHRVVVTTTVPIILFMSVKWSEAQNAKLNEEITYMIMILFAWATDCLWCHCLSFCYRWMSKKNFFYLLDLLVDHVGRFVSGTNDCSQLTNDRIGKEALCRKGEEIPAEPRLMRNVSPSSGPVTDLFLFSFVLIIWQHWTNDSIVSNSQLQASMCLIFVSFIGLAAGIRYQRPNIGN